MADIPAASILGRVRMTAELRYPADPATVFAMLLDRRFQQIKLGLSAGAAEITIDPHGPGGADGATIMSIIQLPTTEMPGMIRNLVGDTLRVERTEEWGPGAADGSRSGTVTLSTPAPVRMNGRLRLRPDADGSVETVDGDLTANVPLIGGRIERSAHPALLAAIEAEGRAGAAWLAERSG